MRGCVLSPAMPRCESFSSTSCLWLLGRCRGKPDLLSAFCKPFVACCVRLSKNQPRHTWSGIWTNQILRCMGRARSLIRGSTMHSNSRSQPGIVSDTCAHRLIKTALRRSWPHCTFISCHFPCRCRDRGRIFPLRQLNAEMNCSQARRDLMSVMSSRCGPSLDGTFTRPRKSASTVSRQNVRRITPIRRRISQASSSVSEGYS